MQGILMTQYDGAILGPIAKVLGYLMEGIFTVLDKIGIPNVGLSIILFTIVIYLLLMPLTIKQQKFSKLSAKMNPEIQAIQAKYKNKKDNDSMMAMNAETQAVYAKYGVSPSGSCIQLLIQMPILFALYRVIYAMPAYVTKIGDTFRVLASKIIEVDNGEYLQNCDLSSVSSAVNTYSKQLSGNLSNGIIDVLNKVSSSDMSALSSHYGLADATYNGQLILSNDTTRGLIDTYNNFLGINIGNSPSYMVGQAWNNADGIQWLALIVAFIIPFLSAFTQWVNVKLMPQAATPQNGASDTQNSMAQSMKTMNMMMPLMSAFFCFTLPAGMGVYWIAGSVVRCIQQIIINKHIDKMDVDELIKKNEAKREAKLKKAGIDPKTLNRNASINTRNVNSAANLQKRSLSEKASSSSVSEKDMNEASQNGSGSYIKNAKPGSLAAKANMVRDYNEKNNK